MGALVNEEPDRAREDQIRALLAEFNQHADGCGMCDTSRTHGTWQAFRCSAGKSMGKRLVTLMMQHPR
jgi:hypothetical protein